MELDPHQAQRHREPEGDGCPNLQIAWQKPIGSNIIVQNDLRTSISAVHPHDMMIPRKSGIASWQLSPLDQYMARIYVRLIFFLSFKDNSASNIEDMIIRLQQGLDATMDRWPFLGGSVSPDEEGSAMGNPDAVKLRYAIPTWAPGKRHEHGEKTKFYAQHISFADWPHEYKEFAKQGPDPEMCLKETFTISQEHPKPGGSYPPLTLTASFLERGGAVLCFAFHHTVFDGSSIAIFLDEFSKNLREQAVSKPVDMASTFRKEVSRLWELGEKIVDPEPTQVPQEVPILRPGEKNSVCRILNLDAAKMAALKANVNNIISKDTPGTWVSTMDCICALIWIAVMRARFHRLPATAITTFATAVDARKRVKSISTDFFGNMFVHAYAKVSVAGLLGAETRIRPTSMHDDASCSTAPGPDGDSREALCIPDDMSDLTIVAEAAQRIRAAVRGVNGEYVAHRFATLAQHGSALFAPDVIDAAHTGVDFSSWVNLGAEVDFGLPGTGGKADWVRKTFSANPGAANVLPRCEDADWEVLLGLEEEEMNHVLSRTELGAWLE